MILTPIAADALPSVLQSFADSLATPTARRVFARLAEPAAATRAAGRTAARHHADAMALATSLRIRLKPGSPTLDFSWDGCTLRQDTEAYVLIHEVAHYQLAAPSRRRIIDFGLGAGPETGNRIAADLDACIFGVARETEEALASLLGILWEVELGHPALASFVDQNWLEGAGRPGAAAHFETILGCLRGDGFLDDALRPVRTLRVAEARVAGSAQGAARAGVVDVHGEAAMVNRGLASAEQPIDP
ncbi:MAG: hypothetical protein JWL84_4544 [Rhodospirillales bacterium]|jgi:hypothetical protein|nr:hypothetical protein [Rhodospirillales bacterium]